MQKTDLRILALAFFFIFGVLLLFSFRPIQEEKIVKECEENATRKCYIGNCAGRQLCSDGEWGECRIDVVCIPGTVEPCVIGYCARTYRVCDECGSGYGDCLPIDELALPGKPAPPP